jgi:hypothetical protein
MHMAKFLKGTAVAGALALSALGFSSAAATADGFSGHWHLTSGNFADRGTSVRIWEHGDGASGAYTLNDGRLEGHINGDQFDGIWVQSRANRRCSESRMGSAYWGRYSLHLSGDGERFHGRWSYCGDADGSGGDWSADRN